MEDARQFGEYEGSSEMDELLKNHPEENIENIEDAVGFLAFLHIQMMISSKIIDEIKDEVCMLDTGSFMAFLGTLCDMYSLKHKDFFTPDVLENLAKIAKQVHDEDPNLFFPENDEEDE